MQKILGYILSPVYYFLFGFFLGVFQIVQVIARKIWGYEAHKRSVGALNYFLVRSLYVLGTKTKFSGKEKLPANRPLIVVANHQSFFDIQALIHAFDDYYPKFVAKIELSRNIPSISYNLKHSGSALIDRENGSQAIREIIRVGRLIEEKNHAVCIFPEGTRSRTGEMRKFQSAGIKTLLKAAPSAVIVPFVINGHSELMEHGYFPLKCGVKVNYTILDPIEPKGRNIDEVVSECESLIKAELSVIK